MITLSSVLAAACWLASCGHHNGDYQCLLALTIIQYVGEILTTSRLNTNIGHTQHGHLVGPSSPPGQFSCFFVIIGLCFVPVRVVKLPI